MKNFFFWPSEETPPGFQIWMSPSALKSFPFMSQILKYNTPNRSCAAESKFDKPSVCFEVAHLWNRKPGFLLIPPLAPLQAFESGLTPNWVCKCYPEITGILKETLGAYFAPKYLPCYELRTEAADWTRSCHVRKDLLSGGELVSKKHLTLKCGGSVVCSSLSWKVINVNLLRKRY